MVVAERRLSFDVIFRSVTCSLLGAWIWPVVRAIRAACHVLYWACCCAFLMNAALEDFEAHATLASFARARAAQPPSGKARDANSISYGNRRLLPQTASRRPKLEVISTPPAKLKLELALEAVMWVAPARLDTCASRRLGNIFGEGNMHMDSGKGRPTLTSSFKSVSLSRRAHRGFPTTEAQVVEHYGRGSHECEIPTAL